MLDIVKSIQSSQQTLERKRDQEKSGKRTLREQIGLSDLPRSSQAAYKDRQVVRFINRNHT